MILCRERRDGLDERGFGPTPERIARADVNDDEPVGFPETGRCQSCHHPGVRVSLDRDLDAVYIGVGRTTRPSRNSGQQVPLVQYRVPGAQFPGAVDRAGVHPRAAPDAIADALPRAAHSREPRAAGAAVQIEGEIEAGAAQPPANREVLADPLQPTGVRRDDHLVEMRIVPDDRRGGFLDDVGEARLRIRPPQRADERGGEDDVPDEPEPQDQDRARRERYGSIVASSISITGMSSLI